MASINKRPERAGTPWEARWREYPGGPQRIKRFARKVDAEQFLDTVRGNIAQGTYVDPFAGKQTFKAFADEWAEAQDWKGTSRDSWQVVRARLVPVLGERPLASIDRLTLQGVQGTLAQQYARTTTTTTMRYARMILRAAVASGRIGRDPTLGLRAARARAGEADGKVGPDQVPTRA
jgi:hypothetical protein